VEQSICSISHHGGKLEASAYEVHVNERHAADHKLGCCARVLQLTVRDALNSALDEEMTRDPLVYIMGEEVSPFVALYAHATCFSSISRPKAWRILHAVEQLLLATPTACFSDSCCPHCCHSHTLKCLVQSVCCMHR
jgi:hypothetical protein